MDVSVIKGNILTLTDEVVIPISAVSTAIKALGSEVAVQNDPLIITQASSLKELPVQSSSLDIVVSISRTLELLGGQLLEEISRVLKPGGVVLIQILQQPSSTLERKILMAGFLEPQVLQLKPFVQQVYIQSLTIKAKKPSWKVGSSFSINKKAQSLPKVQINGDMYLIDEDSLLTEEDLKKPQLPPVGDCEVGSTRKACKNCTCGRVEVEQKVQKLGLTAEQLNNPQSACGNCGLGDAFRCGTCPYKGLPQFKLGDKVSLTGNFLVADI
ncbi:anamorsin homolog [Telopea speciosissima]|uniref:anamorsin homolog n=1 Tax=Telopea speciosissima TaxID=54955 RepID=UPI001CC4D3CC|nr:anamorsin homolog [Telopea speciosissima]XP_043698289.1 anamorsin homolog [Telopea speciosissima]